MSAGLLSIREFRLLVCTGRQWIQDWSYGDVTLYVHATCAWFESDLGSALRARTCKGLGHLPQSGVEVSADISYPGYNGYIRIYPQSHSDFLFFYLMRIEFLYLGYIPEIRDKDVIRIYDVMGDVLATWSQVRQATKMAFWLRHG
jgi:hypothetical protein